MTSGSRINYIMRFYLDIFSLALLYFLTKIVIGVPDNSIQTLTAQIIIIISLISWYISAFVFQLYLEISIISFSQELINFFKVVIIHLLILAFVLFMISNDFKSYRPLIIFYNMGIIIFIPIQKYLYRVVVAFVRKQYKFEKKIIIVGSKFSEALSKSSSLSNNDLRYKILGIIEDEQNEFSNEKYLGNITQLSTVLKEMEVDEVMLALPVAETKKINEAISVCEKAQTRVSILADMNNYGTAVLKATNYAGFPVVNIRQYPLDDLENKFFKRAFDIIFSTLFLIFIFSWLFPIIAVLIKLTSKGPIFFKQHRWGLYNEKIDCLKFRTMYVGSPQLNDDGEYLHTSKNDERVTTIGKLLRKTSFDELPQFLNVLAGTMSIVGPRPHPVPLSIEAKAQIQNYMLRHLVKPGTSGWAQVNGSRGEVQSPQDMQKRVNFDIWYIENWSFGLDFQIIFQTIINMIKGDEKAY